MFPLWNGTDQEGLEPLEVLEIPRLGLVGKLASPYVRIHWVVQFETQEMSDQKGVVFR